MNHLMIHAESKLYLYLKPLLPGGNTKVDLE